MAKKTRKITVEWTGAYPNLCSGEWLIRINGKLIEDGKDYDPYDKRKMMTPYGSVLRESMNTAGTYQSWHFEDWSEVFEDYESGYAFKQWEETEIAKKLFTLIEKNKIILSGKEKEILFEALQDNDWRSGSCGGCI